MARKLFEFFDGEENPKAITAVVVLAVVFHVLVLVVAPLVLSFLWKPKILTRPPTFELVKIQLPQPPAPPARPTPVQPTPQPTPPAPVEPPPAPPAPPEPPRPTPPVEQPRPAEPQPTPPQPTPQPQPRPQPTPPRPTPPLEDDISAFMDLFADDNAAQNASSAQNISLTVAEPFPFQWYLDQLQARIRQRWRPGPNERGEVVVQFTIGRNGSLSNLTMVNSSGRPIMDRQAMQAVQMAAPFAPLPAGFGGQSLTVVLTLRPYG
ncbi:MAG: TonB C-terminal domain-containing protein [Chitinivibrionia bacterium]|nr:TonB C-terminal domain-containing protein [Chitinivibrionia bacterium]